MDSEFDILSNGEISSYDSLSNNDHYQQVFARQELEYKNYHLSLLKKNVFTS